jgi:hypothetical protein
MCEGKVTHFRWLAKLSPLLLDAVAVAQLRIHLKSLNPTEVHWATTSDENILKIRQPVEAKSTNNLIVRVLL